MGLNCVYRIAATDRNNAKTECAANNAHLAHLYSRMQVSFLGYARLECSFVGRNPNWSRSRKFDRGF